MFMSCGKNAGQNYGIKIANKSSETVAEFIYFGMKLTSQNCLYKKKKVQSECQPDLVQNLFYSSVLSKNRKIKIYRTFCFSFAL